MPKQDWNPEDFDSAQEELSKRNVPLEMEELFGILRKVVKGKVYIILDGLDECEPQIQRQLLKGFCDIQQQRNVSLCVASRQELNVAMTRRDITLIKTSLPKHNPDIEEFIDTELHDRLVSNEFNVGSQAVITLVKSALLVGSRGMFLWVVLQINSLCLMESDHFILKAIEDLPSDLPETYRRLLQCAKTKHQQDLQTRILQWMLTSKRPLTTGELKECLGVVPGDLDWNNNKIINSIQAALDCCGGLVNIDEEDFTVRVVHPSVKQFVLSEDTATHLWAINLVDAQAKTALTVLTYLNLRIFDLQLIIRKKPTVDADTIANHVINSVTTTGGVFGRVASSLRMFQVTQNDIVSRAVAQDSDTTSYKFRDYALKYWCRHMVDLEDLGDTLSSLLTTLLRNRRIDLTQWLEGDRSAWVIAASYNRPGLLKMFFKNQNIRCTTNGMIFESLVAAAIHGSIQVLDYLFKHYGFHPNRGYYQQHRTLLHYAAQHNQPDVVDFLFGLQVRVEGESESVVVNPEVHDIHRKTALELAAHNGCLAVVERLCKYYKIPSLQTLTQALRAAAIEGHVEIVQKFLDYGDLYTALALCKLAGFHSVNHTIIQMVAASISDNYCSSFAIREALQLAMVYENLEHFKCLWLLYEDSYSRKDDEPLLIYAMRVNAGKFIGLLLETDKLNLMTTDQWYAQHENTRSDGDNNKTLLHLAAETNHLAVMKALLATDWIDTSLKSKKGKTALDIARRHPDGAIVRALEAHTKRNP